MDLNIDIQLQRLEALPNRSLLSLRRWHLIRLIAISALSILSDKRELTRVKTCPGSDCGWLFLDETKNARRKWCIMET